MDVLTDKKLANYVTMRLGGPAEMVVAVHSEQDVAEAANYAKIQNWPLITLGIGSNIIFRDDGFKGLVIINRVPGFSLDRNNGWLLAGGGMDWDYVVAQSVEASLCGIESLSLIPGTAGAAPVNDIGAYGQEIKNSLISLRAYDVLDSRFVELANSDCDFRYRHSRFKDKEHGRFIICQIKLQLQEGAVGYRPPDYPALKDELQLQNIAQPTVGDVRKAVIQLRQAKLPDPAKIANSGSFFKNPLVSVATVRRLLADYPKMPYFPQTDGSHKLAAGWLIDQAGLKNFRENGMWVYDKQALVLVNESATKFNDLWLMTEHIIKTVNDKFGIMLETEPEII